MVGKVMRKLEELDLLDNTYVIYTSDNGFANGQHRRWPGKSMNYEEDIVSWHVPRHMWTLT